MSCLHSKYKTTVQPHAYAFHLGRIFPIRYLLGFMPRSRRCCWDPSHPPLFQCQEGGKYLSLGRSLAHSPSTWTTGNARTKSVGCKASILIFSAGPKTTFLAGKHLILESIFHIWELQAWCQGHGLLLGTTTSAFFPDPLPKTCFPILLKIGVGEDTWLCSRGHSWCSDERRCQDCNQMIVCVRVCAQGKHPIPRTISAALQSWNTIQVFGWFHTQWYSGYSGQWSGDQMGCWCKACDLAVLSFLPHKGSFRNQLILTTFIYLLSLREPLPGEKSPVLTMVCPTSPRPFWKSLLLLLHTFPAILPSWFTLQQRTFKTFQSKFPLTFPFILEASGRKFGSRCPS